MKRAIGRILDAAVPLRELLGSKGAPRATLDIARAQRIGGVFWLIGGIAAALLLPFSPPTAEIGWVGWPLAVLGVCCCFGLAARRFSATASLSLDEIFYSGWLGLLAIALLEWLAGGLGSPYGNLYVLPALYAGAIHGTRRTLVFLGAVALATALPLIYDEDSKAAAADIAAQIAMLMALAMTARGLITTVRTQRAALMVAAEDAERRARRDPLTGLGNRRAFQEAIDREVANAKRRERPLSVLLGDLENFKAINDAYGHVRGDQCLREVADSISAQARAGDQCFRWGGDEFAILLTETATKQAENVRDRLSGTITATCNAPDGRALRIECVVTSLEQDQGPEELLLDADRALTDLKSSGETRGG